MRVTILAGAVCLALCCAAVQADEPSLDALEALHREAFALDLSPGMAVAVVRGDEVVYARGFGAADLEAGRAVTPETLFYVASTSKSFTAFAAALLDHRGDLDLDKTLHDYLPSLRLATGLDPARISLRDLLTHTHGISNSGPVVFRTAFSGQHSPEQLAALLAEHPPSSSGRSYAYGNLGYNWRVEDGRLTVRMGVMRSSVEIYDREANQLRVELMGRGQVIAFDPPEKDGRIRRLTYRSLIFVRVDP